MHGGEMDGGPMRPHHPSRRGVGGARRGRVAGRRSDSTTAVINAIYPESAAESGPAALGADLQTLLSEVVSRICQRTGADHACAWLQRTDGVLIPMAAHRKRGEPVAPRDEVFAALRVLRDPTDLGARGIAAPLAVFASEAGLAAAVPLRVGPPRGRQLEPAIGALLIGGPDDLPGRVRARTLALLAEQAEALRGPLSAIGALRRIDRLDGAVRDLDRLAHLGDLLTEIVHEVRNPLVSLKTFLQLLPDRLDDPEFVGDFREVVSGELSRLERLLDTVLRLGTSGRQERVVGSVATSASDDTLVADVAETFEVIAQLLAHRVRERRLEIEPRLESGLETALIAPDALRQLVLNLTLNAIDASPPGGRLVLGARAYSNSEGRFVEIHVEDEGAGVPEAARSQIFDAFHSTRDGSPGGLGLAISQRLVGEAGGTIRVEDGAAGGARFVVQLPSRPR